MIRLDTPTSEFTQIGKKTAPLLAKLGVRTIGDLLLYFPFRHEDLSRVVPIALAPPGMVSTIKGRIEQIASRRGRFGRHLVTEAIVADSSGSVKAVWFHQPYLAKMLAVGSEIFLSGKLTKSRYGLAFQAPTWEPVKIVQTHTARIIPVYSTTGALTSRQIRFLVSKSLPLAAQVSEILPREVVASEKLMPRGRAVVAMHFPSNWESLEKARVRFAFEEIFILALRNLILRSRLRRFRAPAIPFDETATRAFVSSLPWRLTDAQRRAAWEIIKDMEHPYPANRLLDGDVGSGKTLVAVIAALNAIRAGYQVALMAPTEILAQQHHQNIKRFLSSVEVALLTGSTENAAAVRRKLSDGQIPFVIGTHALLQPTTKFKNLGLVVVDEQHRFGVEQRKALQKKMGESGALPHLLSMTATPIPRTLALTLYGDLDLSVLDELPPGRTPVETRMVKHGDVEKFIRDELARGRQAFVICPLIDASDKTGKRSVTEEVERLREVFPTCSVAALHGRLKSSEKEKIMADFAAGRTQLLVSTSVVEVGVDVPNATVMHILNADHFGLAQLHQFRGRVGRGAEKSYCFLVPSEECTEEGMRRLQAVAATTNGFKLAEEDLKLRGPGELFGTSQHGFDENVLIGLADPVALRDAQKHAKDLLARDPQLKNHPDLAAAVRTRVGAVHLE